MDDEKPVEIAGAENGDPILDQFSAEGFIDCTFRIVNQVSSEHQHRFHLTAWHDGESVGFDVVIVKGIRGAFDREMELIPDHVYRDGVRFLRSGPESDRLMTVLASLYALSAKDRRMVDSFSFVGIALHHDDVDMESEPIKIKLFGKRRRRHGRGRLLRVLLQSRPFIRTSLLEREGYRLSGFSDPRIVFSRQ